MRNNATIDTTAPAMPAMNQGESRMSTMEIDVSLIRLLVTNQLKMKYAAVPMKKPKRAKIVKIFVRPANTLRASYRLRGTVASFCGLGGR